MSILENSINQKLSEADQAVVSRALKIMEEQFKYCDGITFNSPDLVIKYLNCKLRGLDREVFSVIFLDTKHKLISYDEMFIGTLSSCSVYPREVARAALNKNAASVILAHNHPSGCIEPSQSDKTLTAQIIAALNLFDINVLDHIIIGDGSCSFAEIGLI